MLPGLKGLVGLHGVVGGKKTTPGTSLLQNYITRLNAQGGSLTGIRLTSLTTLLDTLVTSGVANRLQYAVLPGAPDSFTGFNVPLIDSLALGICTSNYVSDEWTGAGLKGAVRFLESPYVPATHGTIDNTHLSIYFSENKAAGFADLLGCGDEAGALQMYSDTYLVCNQHTDGSDRTFENATPLAGLLLGSRSSATLHELRTPSGGGSDKLANSSTNIRQGGLPSANFQMISSGNSTRILFSSVGLSVNGPQYTVLANALATYSSTRGI